MTINAFGKTASKTIRVSEMQLSSIPNSLARCVLWLKQPLEPNLCTLGEVPAAQAALAALAQPRAPGPCGGAELPGWGSPWGGDLGSHSGAHTEKLPCALFSVSPLAH